MSRIDSLIAAETRAARRAARRAKMIGMRIIGHGVDIVDVASLDRLRVRPHFDERCFTGAERNECENAKDATSFFAGRFAAKEAVLKALGTGLIDGISLRDVVLTASAAGAPLVALHGGAASRAAALGVTDVFVSISHTEMMAMASAIAVAQDAR